jgi:hypothetical protein
VALEKSKLLRCSSSSISKPFRILVPHLLLPHLALPSHASSELFIHGPIKLPVHGLGKLLPV